MTHFSDREKYQVLARLSLISLYIIVGIDLVLIAAGYYLIQSKGLSTGPDLTLIRNILFLVAISELGAMHIVKKSMLAKIQHVIDEEKLLYSQLFRINIVIAAMCVSISIYGLVIIILGGEFKLLMLFIAISLIGYQLFRLRAKDIEKLRS